MKYFKKEPENIQEILTKALWQNNIITNSKKHLLSKNILEKKGILFVNDIINNKG